MDILTILLGMSPANTNGDERRALKTEILDYGKVGVINGTPVAFNGVNEANNRGGAALSSPNLGRNSSPCPERGRQHSFALQGGVQNLGCHLPIRAAQVIACLV